MLKIEGIKVVDPEGEDLTPNKVKEIQKETSTYIIETTNNFL